MKQAGIVVPLAEGFEEVEAVTIIDVLRRADQLVTTVALKPGPVRGAHGIVITADCSIDEIDSESVRMVVLPGGMPGAANLRDDPRVIRLLQSCARRGAVTAAICAAPMVLAKAGLLRGKRATCYPGFERELEGATPSTDRVVVDGSVVTSRGPGTALEFALALVKLLQDEPASRKLGSAMLVSA